MNNGVLKHERNESNVLSDIYFLHTYGFVIMLVYSLYWYID